MNLELFPVNRNGLALGETHEMWLKVTMETLEYVRDNTRNSLRRQRAIDEINRRLSS